MTSMTLFHGYPAPLHLEPIKKAIFLASDADIWQKNHQRQDKSLPNDVLQDMLLRFEHPLFDEFERIDDVVNGYCPVPD